LIICIDSFTIDELKQQFEELLRAYRDFELLSKGSKNTVEEDEDSGDRKMLQQKANLARETFEAGFGSKLEQRPTFLSSAAFEIAVGTMVKWASELLPHYSGHETFPSVEACSARLRELVSEPDRSLSNAESRTCWPFIKKLRVYLNAHILSKGLIITDLPGLRDLNSARRAITERYVRQCDRIFVVARIERAITDQSIDEIFKLARRVSLSQIDIVCTRSEDIHTDEALHDWSGERLVIKEMQKEIGLAANVVEILEEDIKEFEQGSAELTQEEEQQLLRRIQEKRKAVVLKDQLDLKLHRYISGLRNNKVSRRLREQYRAYPNAGSLRIFCVSNKLYSNNRNKLATAALPYLNWSGILELRRYCIGMVAQNQLHIVRKFILNEVPAMLGSLELWIEAGSKDISVDSKNQIIDTVSDIQHTLDEVSTHHLAIKT
jgi:hypothetical protein